MNRENYNFTLPYRDSNKLKYLDQIKVDYEGSNLNINFNKYDSEKDEFKLQKIQLNTIIDYIEHNIEFIFSFKDGDYELHDVPLGLRYVLSLFYLWDYIENNDEKVTILNIISKLSNLLKDQIFYKTEITITNNLINLLIFCTTNVVFQEFERLEYNLLKKKTDSEKKLINADIKHKKKNKLKKENKLLYDEKLDDVDSEIDKDIEDNSIINNESSILEIIFSLFKNLIEFYKFYLSNNKLNKRDSSIEWLLILSLKIKNTIENLSDEIDNEDYYKEYRVNKTKWNNLSEILIINILNSIDLLNKEKNNHIFEIISNCLINGSIDLISNVNGIESLNINKTIFKDFPSYLSKLLSYINKGISNDIFINIMEELETFWRKVNKSFVDDDKLINCLNVFIETLSNEKPVIILNNISLIRRIMRVMISYKLRSNFIVNVTNSLVKSGIDSSNISENEKRSQIIETIDFLLERIYDKHQNCRTRSIQCLENLMTNDFIPYTFFIPIMKEIKIRTLDESSYVRSSSFNLLRIMVRKATENYYQMSLNHDDIDNLMKNIENELCKLSNEVIDDINNNIVNAKLKREFSNLSTNLLEDNNEKKEAEYELMKILLIDAKEVSLIVESILDEVCNNGIYSKISSDSSSCILFISECISLNIKKSFVYFSDILKFIWRINNPNIVNSLIHGFYIIMFSTSIYLSNPNNSEDQNQCDVENENKNLKFDNKITINESCIKNLLKVIVSFSDDDFANLLKLLESLSSINNNSVSKKYIQNFDINLFRKCTLNEISSLKNIFFSNISIEIEIHFKSLFELYIVILKVITLNNNQICNFNDKSIDIIYEISINSINNGNFEIFEYTIKCFSLMYIDIKYEKKILENYMSVLTENKITIYNNSLFINIIDSIFILIGNPSNIKYKLIEENNSKILLLDLFLNNLIEYYAKKLKESKEVTFIELSQILLILSHITLKYGNFVENIYNKWKNLHSLTNKNLIDPNKPQNNNEYNNLNIEEEYFEYTQMILEHHLVSNQSIFYLIVPIVNFLSRDPNILIEYEDDNNLSDTQWQLDYSRNCALISLCKLISLTTKLLDINNDLINQNLIPNLNINSKLSNLIEMPNIELIFSFIYNPSSICFIDEKQLDDIRLNIILCTNDLLTRYPNIIDPWMEKQYSILNFNDQIDELNNKDDFRYNIMLIINYLLNIGFIKPKDTLLLNYLKCINNKSETNSELSNLANSFFQEFFKDFNNQFSINVIPFLINQLAFEYSKYSEDKFKTQTIIGQAHYVLHFISNKEKICSDLIPKFFTRISQISDLIIIEFYVNIFEFLKLNLKNRCINKIIENLHLINYQIKEFDILKQYFLGIFENHNIKNVSESNNDLLNFLKNDLSNKNNLILSESNTSNE